MPTSGCPQVLKTTEDALRELLQAYKNNEYTLSELKAIADSWTQRSNFQQFLLDNSQPKMDRSPQANGFFSRFFPPTTKGKETLDFINFENITSYQKYQGNRHKKTKYKVTEFIFTLKYQLLEIEMFRIPIEHII